jgi:hypothetical protein
MGNGTSTDTLTEIWTGLPYYVHGHKTIMHRNKTFFHFPRSSYYFNTMVYNADTVIEEPEEYPNVVFYICLPPLPVYIGYKECIESGTKLK